MKKINTKKAGLLYGLTLLSYKFRKNSVLLEMKVRKIRIPSTRRTLPFKVEESRPVKKIL